MNRKLSTHSRRSSRSKADARHKSFSDDGAGSAVHQPNEDALRDSNTEPSELDRLIVRRTSDPENKFQYPDGGIRAWSVVAGSFSGFFACFGVMNSIGTFEAYISTHQLSGSNPGAVGFIFSLYFLFNIFLWRSSRPNFRRQRTSHFGIFWRCSTGIEHGLIGELHR